MGKAKEVQEWKNPLQLKITKLWAIIIYKFIYLIGQCVGDRVLKHHYVISVEDSTMVCTLLSQSLWGPPGLELWTNYCFSAISAHRFAKMEVPLKNPLAWHFRSTKLLNYSQNAVLWSMYILIWNAIIFIYCVHLLLFFCCYNFITPS